MANGTHEQTINVALGELLAELRPTSWSIRSERTGDILVGGGRPDILIEEPAGWPVVIEAERENRLSAEQDAQARLRKKVVSTGRDVEAAVALVYPPPASRLDGARLREFLLETPDLEYALYTIVDPEANERLPQSGWLRGSIRDLALLLRRATMPPQRVDRLAEQLQFAINAATENFTRLHPSHAPGSYGDELAQVLGQTDDEGNQTRRMVMTVLANALIYHAALAAAEFNIDTHEGSRRVRPIEDFRSSPGMIHLSHLLDEWYYILRRNYWPIFAAARSLARALSPPAMSLAFGPLHLAVTTLMESGITRSHELNGAIMQRLIADRKFLATFYTRPAAAALLASLAIPTDRAPGGADWSDAETLASLQIGDFACGTGTLLSAAYQRVSILHELQGGDPRALHAPMMENGLVGLDVLNIAVHLTASMLASVHPTVPFDGECLLTMPFGKEDAAIGSLELLAKDVQPSLISSAAAVTAGGREPENVRDLVTRVGHSSFDLAIMNPPFTNAIAHEGTKVGVGNPAFAAFETPPATRDKMLKRLNTLAGPNKTGNLRAGLGTHFVDLAIRKTARGGGIAFVLPLSALAGIRWEKTRRAIADNFDKITVVTIAGEGSDERSFSTDTGIAECLVVAANRDGRATRATFVVLNDQPMAVARSELIGDVISHMSRNGHIDEFENGNIGATRITLGTEYAGFGINFPLPERGPWPMAGLLDVELAQVAHHLTNGQFHQIGSPNAAPIDIPIAPLAEIASVGSSDMEIIGNKPDGSPQGAFDLHHPPVNPSPTYPMLWRHDADRERQLIVLPDSEGTIKEWPADQQWVNAKAARLWATASRAHYNRDLQFNSQPLIVAMTDRLCIGGRAWPSVVLGEEEHEFAFSLWCNSSLGLLLHWWIANKSQAGRGSTTVTAMPSIPTLDLERLTVEQHERAQRVFDELRDAAFLPFHLVHVDPARHELDRRLLTDVLDLPAALTADGGPIDLIRRKLAHEPQIYGQKRPED